MGEREEEGRERKERAGGSRRHGGGGKGRRKLHEKRDLTGREGELQQNQAAGPDKQLLLPPWIFQVLHSELTNLYSMARP